MNVSVRGLWNVEFHNSSRKNNPSYGKNIKKKLDAWCFWANQGPKNIATHEKHDITESHFSICWGAKSERPSWVEQNTKCTMHHCRMQMRKSCYRPSDQMGSDQEAVQRTEGTRSQASRAYTKVSWQALCRIRCFLLRSLHTLSLKKLSWQDLQRSLCNVSAQVLYKRSPGKILQGCLKKASQKRAGLEWYQNRWTDQCWSTLLVLPQYLTHCCHCFKFLCKSVLCLIRKCHFWFIPQPKSSEPLIFTSMARKPEPDFNLQGFSQWTDSSIKGNGQAT